MAGFYRPQVNTGLPPVTPQQRQADAQRKADEQKSDQRYGYSLGLDAIRQAYENQARGIYNNINLAELGLSEAQLRAAMASQSYGLAGDSFQQQLASGRLRGDLASLRVEQARAARNAQQELARLKLSEAQDQQRQIPNDFMEAIRGFQR